MTFAKNMKNEAEQKLAYAKLPARPSFDTPQDDPRLADAQKNLGMRLAHYMEQNPHITQSTSREMEGIVRDFRTRCKNRGIDVPRLRIVYFTAMCQICVWPEEIEPKEIQKRLSMFITHRQRHGLAVDAQDIAKGVRRAYPEYQPGLILPSSTLQETMQ